MMRLAAWKALTLFLMAAACTATPPSQPRQTDTLRFLSLTPASLGRSLSLSQRVIGEYDNRRYEMRFEVEITPARLTIVGLSLVGVTLFTLVQDQGKDAVITQIGNRIAMDPRHMLFDLYLTYWPSEILQTALLPHSMRLEEIRATSVRRVRGSDGMVIAEIAFPDKNQKSGEIVIQHFDIPYRLRIVSFGAGGAY